MIPPNNYKLINCNWNKVKKKYLKYKKFAWEHLTYQRRFAQPDAVFVSGNWLVVLQSQNTLDITDLLKYAQKVEHRIQSAKGYLIRKETHYR